MKLTAFAVRHWRLVIVALVLAIGLGAQALLTMPRSVDPYVDFPFSTVTVALPGANAADMEETVAKPIENALQGLDNVREVRSNTIDGLSIVSAEYDYGTDPEDSLNRAITQVASIRSMLPAGITQLEFTRPRPTEAALLQLALVSEEASWRRMQHNAQNLSERLVAVDGVRNTLITGLRQPEVQVLLDAGKMSTFQLSATAIAQAIADEGLDVSVGAVHVNQRRLNIATQGAFRDLERLRNVPVRAAQDGSVLRVGDVATVEWGVPEQLTLTRFNGERAVFVAVRQKDSASAVPLRDALFKEIDRFRETLPPDIKLEIGFDQSKEIRNRLNELGREFLIALALVLLTLSPLGRRPAFIVMVSIPASLAIGVWALSSLGYGLNQISIAGFIIALGLVVDDSIVVVENVARHLRSGKQPSTAAAVATAEISAAVLGSTAVLILAFLPLANLPEAAGDFVRGLPMAVITTVIGSLVVSLTIIPVLASRYLRGGEDAQENAILKRLNGSIERFYQPVLKRALDHPKRTVIGAMLVCFAAIGAIPVVGFSLFPAADVPQLLVRVELPEGSSVSATEEAIQEISEILAKEESVLARMESAGRGNPQIFYNSLPREADAQYGEIFFTLREWDPVEGPAFISRLRQRLDSYPDARATVIRFENGTPSEAPVVIRVKGPELETLKSLAARVAAIMGEIDGLRDIHDPMATDRLDLDISVDTQMAAALGVSAREMKRALRIAVSGEQVASFRDSEGASYPVTVRLPIEDRHDISILNSINLTGFGDADIPLSQIASPVLVSAPAQITRMRMQRFVAISAHTEPGVLASSANAQLLSRMESLELPAGYTWQVGGQAEDSARTTSGLGSIGVIAVFCILAILILEFGSFRDVLVVVAVVPLGLVGGIAALLASGNSLSFFASIGFVALIGIEIKNSILLVDFTRRLREEGMQLRAAMELAGRIRFLPVLLTSVTAIAALLPLALSNQSLYSPLAWVIIGGLVSSTVLSRVVIPSMYLLVSRE